MGYRLVADAVMLVHFGFLAFVVAGGFVAWRWPRALWAHLAAALWGFATVMFQIRCPLSDVEDWARIRAGQARLRGSGFIDTYVENVLYPERYTHQLQAAAAAVVLVSWAGFARRQRRRRSAGGSVTRPDRLAVPGAVSGRRRSPARRPHGSAARRSRRGLP